MCLLMVPKLTPSALVEGFQLFQHAHSCKHCAYYCFPPQQKGSRIKCLGARGLRSLHVFHLCSPWLCGFPPPHSVAARLVRFRLTFHLALKFGCESCVTTQSSSS